MMVMVLAVLFIFSDNHGESGDGVCDPLLTPSFLPSLIPLHSFSIILSVRPFSFFLYIPSFHLSFISPSLPSYLSRWIICSLSPSFLRFLPPFLPSFLFPPSLPFYLKAL